MTPNARLCLAALLAGGLLALAPIQWGMASSFAKTLPIIVLCGGWLARQTPRLGPTALALLLCIPIVGTRMWEVSLVEFDALYIPSYWTDARLLELCAAALRPLVPLCLASALALAVIGGPGTRMLAGVFCLGAASTAGSTLTLQTSLQALQSGDYERAARLVQLTPAWALLPLLLLPAIRGQSGLLRLAVILCVASTTISPIQRVLPPQQPTTASSPQGRPGLPTDLVPLDPRHPDFFEHLTQAGVLPSTSDFWCAQTAHWDRVIRLTVNLTLSADDDVSAVTDVLPELLQRGVQQLALQGRTDPLPGRLGARLSHPAPLVLLDPPPADAGHARLTEQGLEWIRPATNRQCFIETTPGLSIQTLYTHLQALQDPRTGQCTASVGLSLHTFPARADGWRPPGDCPAVESKAQE